MKTLNGVAFFRTDLKERYTTMNFNTIIYDMLTISETGVVLHEDIAVFIDDNGSTKILKNRLGRV